MSIAFKIVGYEKECHCDHCGRALQHGVRTDSQGVLGADCFVSMIVKKPKDFKSGKPDAAFVRTLAKLAERDDAAMLRRMGYPASLFQYELKEGA